MTAESDSTVHGPNELAGPIPVSARKDLTERRPPNGRRRRRKKRPKPDEKSLEPQLEPDPPDQPDQDDRDHEVDYLA